MGMGAAQVIANVAGPTATPLRWSTGMQRALGAAIREARCPYFVQAIMSFDRPLGLGSWAFGEDLIARSELYRPVESLGPATFATVLRDEPAPSRTRPLDAVGVPGRFVAQDDRAIEVRFDRPVAWEHLLEIDYRLDASTLSQLVGSPPWVRVRLFDGDEAVGEPMVFPGLELGERARAHLPVHPEMAEWRWVVGRPPPTERTVDRMVFEVQRRALTIGEVSLTLFGIAERVPGAPPIDTRPRECDREVDLAGVLRDGRGFVRAAERVVEGSEVRLRTNGFYERLSEVFLPVRPCADSCLMARVRLTVGERAGFEIHAIEGADRPRLVSWELGPEYDRPLEIPIGAYAGRTVWLRIGTLPQEPTGEGAVIRVDGARIARCASLGSLIQAAHDGGYAAPRGGVDVSGDQIQLTLHEPFTPVVEARIPVTIPEEACLAVDLTVPPEWNGVPFAVDVGLAIGDVVWRFRRPAVWTGNRMVRLHDVDMRRWVGQDVDIRFAAWPLTSTVWETTAVVARPRIHRCNDGAPWAF